MAKPVSTEIHVTGLKEFVKAARKAKDKETLDAVKHANKEAAETVSKEAKTLVPTKTGKLAKSIKANATARKGVVSAGRKAIPYAGVIHFGWAAHNISPQPFIYDALDNRRGQVIQAYEDQISKVVNDFG